MVLTLTILFFLSYALMVLLIVEQSHTIQSQRVMIQQLLVDSTQLSHMKIQALQQQRSQAKASAEGQTQKRPKTEIQAPSHQVPTREQSKEKTRVTVPQRPTMPASDKADLRRSVKLI